MQRKDEKFILNCGLKTWKEETTRKISA